MVAKLTVFAVALCFASAAAAQTAPAQTIAPGVHLLRGAMLPERGPDGNSVLLETGRGLIVVDTGRHPWHSDAILAFAEARRLPIVAIVNTHWHLDHASGNHRIKARFPRATIYTTGAVERALAAGGFLRREEARRRAATPRSAVEAEEAQVFFDTMGASGALRPERVVSQSGPLRIGGRRIEARVAPRAVTDADLWLLDRRSKVAVLGDLVTLPAPFFETACPERWRDALDAVWASPFEIAIPGHGAPMDRAAFDVYRRAFAAFLDCVASATEAPACASAWAGAVAPLVGEDRGSADAFARYYVAFLRGNGGLSPDCLER